MRIAIIDDMLLIREGLASALGERGIDVVAQASDADQLLALVARHRPDVVVLDIRMPPTFTDEGLRAAAALRSANPGVGIPVALAIPRVVVRRAAAA